MVGTSPNQPSPVHEHSRLTRLARIAAKLGIDELATEVTALAQRVDEVRLYVAVIGQFKRGKSTLLNALVDEAVLPTGVVPVTSVITVLRHGERRRAVVTMCDGERREIGVAELSAFVTEERNPGNLKHVLAVEIFLPHPLLASGTCLVDTPGLGSVFTASTAATRAFVPQVDAAIVVLGADPPVSAEELDLVTEIARQTHEIVFVLNKADRLSDAERGEAKAFCERVLSERLGRTTPILEVSATERPAGGTARDWPALLARVGRVGAESGPALLRAAEARGVRVFGARLRQGIDERRGALARPLAESAARIDTLRRCASDAERSLGDLRALLAAEQHRLHAAFVARQETFLSQALPAARAELAGRLAAASHGTRAAYWRGATAAAQDIFRNLLDRWRVTEQPAAQRMYADATERFVRLADAFLARAVAAGLLGGADDATRMVGDAQGFTVAGHLYFTGLLSETTRSPQRWLLDTILPGAAFRRDVERQAQAYLERLIRTNASRVSETLAEQARESARRLETDVRARIREVYVGAERALRLAREQRERGSAAVARELERLGQIRASVDALCGEADSHVGP